MKHVYLIFLLGITLVSCSAKLDTDKKRVSYTIGQQVAANIRQSGMDVDVDVLLRSIKAGLEGKKSELTETELQQAISKVQLEMQKKAAQEIELNLQAGAKFLEANAKRPGVKTTSSGLQYEVQKEGAGKKPHAQSLVLVHYTGSLMNTTVFESTRIRNAPIELKMNGIVPGLAEGIKLMGEGGKYRFYLPPKLAYGAQARPGIPAGSVLIFDVELLKVK